MSKQALSNTRVIDLTRFIAGPYCTKLLAGFGAEVIKIEMPKNGDGLRNVEPFYRNEQGVEHSIPFLWFNTGKKSITLNLKASQGIEIIKRLVETADVLVENFSPGVMGRLGLDYETLKSINPKLIMVSISNFGQSGPYRDFKADEIELQALSGLMDNTGAPDMPPLAAGPALCQLTAAMHSYAAILMAILQRNRTGEGRYVDVSIMESSMEQIENRINTYLLTGKVSKRGPHIFAPWGLYDCQDGYVNVISAPFRHWENGAEIFEEPRLREHQFQHLRERVQHRQEIDALIQPWLDKKKKQQVFKAGQEKGLSFGFLANLDEALDSPQHRERGFFKSVEHPAVGTQLFCDAPFKMSATPWHTAASPRLGEHNDVIYGSVLGYSDEERRQWAAQGVI